MITPQCLLHTLHLHILAVFVSYSILQLEILILFVQFIANLQSVIWEKLYMSKVKCFILLYHFVLIELLLLSFLLHHPYDCIEILMIEQIDDYTYTRVDFSYSLRYQPTHQTISIELMLTYKSFMITGFVSNNFAISP